MKYFQANALHAAGQLPLMQHFVMSVCLCCIHLIIFAADVPFLYYGPGLPATGAKVNFPKE